MQCVYWIVKLCRSQLELIFMNNHLNTKQLILGGVKSGKSTFAISGLDNLGKKVFIATAQAFDDEMTNKIKRHQDERDDTFFTIEEPVDMEKALKQALTEKASMVIIDCLTLWVSNLIYFLKDESVIETEIQKFEKAIKEFPLPLRIVSNEVGLGVIGIDQETRLYVNLLGTTNQRIARVVDQTVLMVAGRPLYL